MIKGLVICLLGLVSVESGFYGGAANGNFIIGNRNFIPFGNNNKVFGSFNNLAGNNNMLISTNSNIGGSNNWIVGNGVNHYGNNFKMFGPQSHQSFWY